MDRETYIRERAQWLVGQVVIDGDDLDLHLIESILEEVFQAGYDTAEEKKGK